MTEEWRPITNFEGHYEVSNLGRVRSLDRVIRHPDGHLHQLRGRVLSPGAQPPFGHLHVNLKMQARRRTIAVHALVLEEFVGPRSGGMECLHGDGDPSNNRVENLRWGTRSENNLDAVRHGTHWQVKKTHCPAGHEYSDDNVILKSGGRECRTCLQAKWRARPLKPKATHCRRGHEYTDTNTRMTDRGRMCLTCFDNAQKARKEARRSKAA
jgi:hypothetical protein